MTDETSTSKLPEENLLEANPDAKTSVFRDVLPSWGDEILEKMRAAGHNRPGVFIAINGDDGKVATTGNYADEDVVDFLDFLLARAKRNFNPLAALAEELGGKVINLGDGIYAFGLDGLTPPEGEPN